MSEPSHLDTFTELQQIDAERAGVLKRREQYPAALRQVEAALAQRRAALAEMRRAQAADEARRRQLERELDTLEQSRQHSIDQQRQVTNEKQQHAIEKQLEQVGEKISDLEDAILGLIDAGEERAAALRAGDAALAQAEADAARETARLTELLATTQAELDLLDRDRRRFRDGLDARLAAEYDNLAARHPGSIVVEPRDSACGGCFTELLPTTLVELNQGHTPHCPHCGRILRRRARWGRESPPFAPLWHDGADIVLQAVASDVTVRFVRVVK